MRADITFDKPTYVCDESAWVRALDYAVHAETVATFKKRLADWLPLFPDVAAAIDTLSDSRFAEWQDFRRGLQAERDKRFAGEEWAERFGCILIPRNALLATMHADRAEMPWGALLMRIAGEPR